MCCTQQPPQSGMIHTDQGAAAMQSEKRPQMVSSQQQLNEGQQRTVVGAPPQLPSGTQRAFEKVLEESLRKMRITPQFQQTNGPINAAGLNKVLRSTARNSVSFNAGNSQFSFPNLNAGSVPSAEGKQIFATVQWRPKEPPAYTGAASNDIYLWTSLVRQYFVFTRCSSQQEIAFEATLLRGTAHQWYFGYEKRNGYQPPRD